MENHSTEYLVLRAAATSAIQRYTGWDLRPREVEVAKDPSNPDLIAIQVKRFDGTHQFLYDRTVGDESVEEVEFTTWPPRSADSMRKK